MRPARKPPVKPAQKHTAPAHRPRSAQAPAAKHPAAAANPAQEETRAALQTLCRRSRALPVIAVVGGGAAGLAAALTAAQTAQGTAQVVLLEKSARVGRKLLASGNGRCNLSNTDVTAAHYATLDAPELQRFLTCRAPTETQEWMSRLGLLCREEDGRLYPFSEQAAAVLDLLRSAVRRAGVLTLCGCRVGQILPREGQLVLRLQTDGGDGPAAETFSLPAARVVLSTGGAAAPALGGSTEGYALLPALGHSCTPLAPALVGLRCTAMAGTPPADLLPGLKGVRAQAAATLYVDCKPVAVQTGEVQFNSDGLSGIPILQLSLLLPAKGDCRLSLNLLPQLPPDSVSQLLKARRALPGLPLEELLWGTVHKKLGAALLKAAGCGPLEQPAARLEDRQLYRLAGLLTALPLTVTGTQGWQGAQATRGGVPLSEVEPAACASRRCGGLYLAGEVLDAVGECGGYNLDWAFSTGRRAGRAAALSLLSPQAQAQDGAAAAPRTQER